ncbi:uncharacterized protein DUF4258 [Chitinophaga skermanii]|uniref:Uncharacterized protein DUF4258 n=1 Tax=Chitinophaga skermanii TaxID=331697 RepID=A0A327Q6H0_9BACT|nr:DUF4258 domain-containing protein [Chitinophaga skermanii]RAI99397.1 uncharacterized protein DUF4258 [Chitinophaga skermanii]
MYKAWKTAALAILTLILAIGCEQPISSQQAPPKAKASRPATKSTASKKDVPTLKFTKHALCRMACRRISEEEVLDMYMNGKVNPKKSEKNGKPCPTIAREGYTSDGQHVRIVFGECGGEVKVITCIDLERDWSCECP